MIVMYNSVTFSRIFSEGNGKLLRVFNYVTQRTAVTSEWEWEGVRCFAWVTGGPGLRRCSGREQRSTSRDLASWRLSREQRGTLREVPARSSSLQMEIWIGMGMGI